MAPLALVPDLDHGLVCDRAVVELEDASRTARSCRPGSGRPAMKAAPSSSTTCWNRVGHLARVGVLRSSPRSVARAQDARRAGLANLVGDRDGRVRRVHRQLRRRRAPRRPARSGSRSNTLVAVVLMSAPSSGDADARQRRGRRWAPSNLRQTAAAVRLTRAARAAAWGTRRRAGREVIDSPASQRPWALFAYLALAPAGASRNELATRFWPDVLDESARASLRSALWALRRQLGDCVAVDGERVEAGGRRRSVGRRARVRAPGRGRTRAGAGAVPGAAARTASRTSGCWPRASAAANARSGSWSNWRSRASAQATAAARFELTRRQAELRPPRRGRPPAPHRAALRQRRPRGRDARVIARSPAAAARTRGGAVVAHARADRAACARRTRRPRRHTTPTWPAGPLPLVGRERELRDLEDVWRGVSSGRGATAVIRGEAGIGKTRLAGELRARAAAGDI